MYSPRSIRGEADAIVYVDSGSTDASLQIASSLGVDAASLDLSTPFSAAPHDKSAGWQRLVEDAIRRFRA